MDPEEVRRLLREKSERERQAWFNLKHQIDEWRVRTKLEIEELKRAEERERNLLAEREQNLLTDESWGIF